MWLRWSLPTIFVSCGILSILILKSVAPSLAGQQFIFFLLGAVVFFFISHQSYRRLEQTSIWAYFLLILLLIVTMVIGSVTRGSTRWISVGNWFNIQASQLAIPIVTLFAANHLIRHPLNNWKNILSFLAIIGLPALLIFIEPDLGTTLVYCLSLATLIFFKPPKWRHMLVLASITLAVLIFSWDFVLQPYQKERLTSFMSAHSDTQDTGYNARQALIAVGAGQIWGRGLGQGVQSHLRFLPERQTDFIFASLAEELGLIGSLLVLIFYALIIFNLFLLAQRTSYPPAQLYCLTMIVMTMVQAGINIGMNVGLLPITGVTLPLLSYGGSSVVSLAGSYAIAHSLINHSPTPTKISLVT